MQLIDTERSHLANLLSSLYDSQFAIYNDRLMIRRYQGDLAHLSPEMYTDEQGVDLLKKEATRLAETLNEADLFITLVNSGAAEK